MSLKKNQIQKENQILKIHSAKIKAAFKKTKIKAKGKTSADSEKLLNKIQPSNIHFIHFFLTVYLRDYNLCCKILKYSTDILRFKPVICIDLP